MAVKFQGFTIDQITINNFRSFKEGKNSKIKNASNSKILIFTGINNVGKTNILRAISLFFNPENYNSQTDLNYIVSLQKTSAPIITIIFKNSQREKIEIKCDFKNWGNSLEPGRNKNYDILYSSKSPQLKGKKEIKAFLDTFKCIFLSVTDEKINNQVSNTSDEMLVRYYRTRSKPIKKKIEEFETKYKELCASFRDNIKEIEESLTKQFEEIGDNISAKFKIHDEFNINSFLEENFKFQLDDTYKHEISNKGSGIQRIVLIYMNLYLLKEIYPNKNLILLLDEPEAFMYPLLEKKIIEKIIKEVENNQLQVYITTHSREFIKEKEACHFYSVFQEQKGKIVARKGSREYLNKYSVVEEFDKFDFNRVYKNYGMLDEIDDYEDILICEGKTDKNYLEKIMKKYQYRPQIRVTEQYDHDFMGKGASSIPVHLAYLNNFNIRRRVFVLLDGDQEGKAASKKIEKSMKSLKNLEIKIKLLELEKEIEDYVYTEETLKEKIKICEPLLYTTIKSKPLDVANNFIESIKIHCQVKKKGFDEHKLKYSLSKNLEENTSPVDGYFIEDDLVNFFVNMKK